MWHYTNLTSNILYEVDQTAIWSDILEVKVLLHRKYKNLLRLDNNPGCWIENVNGVLRLIDFADKDFNRINAIDGIRLKYGLSYGDALNKILEIHINSGKFVLERGVMNKFNFILQVKKRDFNRNDLEFFEKRNITLNQLQSDNIFPVECYRCNSKREPNTLLYFYPKLAYCVLYPSGRKKIYIPDSTIKSITNCNQEDLGGYWSPSHPQLVISKSYKDYRVLKNIGFNTCFTINEGCKPEILKEEVKKYKDVVIFYDNDKAGIKAAESLKNFIGKGRTYFIKDSNHKDPDELMVANKIHLIAEDRELLGE